MTKRRLLFAQRSLTDEYATFLRSSMAAVWLNEEWFSQKIRGGNRQAYDQTLLSLLEAAIERKELGDKALSQFLTKVPEISALTLNLLRRLCEDPET